MSNHEGIQRIDCSHIALGMRVIELDRPWIESPFTIKGFLITTAREIAQLQRHCKYVYIAEVTTTDIVILPAIDPLAIEAVKIEPEYHASIPTERPQQQISYPSDHYQKPLGEHSYTDSQSMAKALPEAMSVHSMATSTVKELMADMRLGKTFDTVAAKQVVKQCVDSVIANEKAMLWLSLLKNVDEYTAQHSVNVGLLSIVLGRAEGLSPAELETVGLCGMMHDIGKSIIPQEILNKSGAFSGDEFEIMKTHTTRGYNIITGNPDIETIVAEVAYSHHERLNGKGYPRKLPAENISFFTRIVAIADTYDAITSKRVYSPAKSALEALTVLIGAGGTHFDSELVQRFVECIGIYPVGAIAELSNREVAIVLPSSPEQQDRPRVLRVRDHNKKPCEELLLNLADEPKDQYGEVIRINHLLSEGLFDIELTNYHEQITDMLIS